MRLPTRLAAFAVAALLFAACSGQSADRSASKATVAEGVSAAPAVGSDSSAVVPHAAVPAAVVPTDGRQVVTNAMIGLKARRVVDATARATAIVTAAGGHLFSENAAVGRSSDAMLVYKVPPIAFATVLDQLAGLGKQVSRQVTTDDVTAQTVDLEGRLASATASTARLRTLYDRADKVADVVAIESELVKREAEVETLQGQLRVVQAQVAFATVTVNVAKLVPARPPAQEASGFVAGLSTGWGALVTAVGAGATVLGVLLPFLALAAVAGAITLAVRRRPRPTAPIV